MGFRVLFYSVIDRMDRGGAQMVVSRLLSSLRARGHDITEAWAAPAEEPAPDEWVCPLHVRPVPDNDTMWARPYHIPSLARLATGLTARRPEIVNVHFISEQALYFLRLGRIFGFKTVLSAHGSDILEPVPSAKPLLPMFLREADAITVVSNNLKDVVLAHGGVDPSKVHVIPNGIDCDFWAPAEPSEDAEDGPPTVVAVGRLDQIKGFDILLEAFARTRAAVPEARLRIIGDGPAEDELRNQIQELGLTGAVDLTGRLGREEVRDSLRRAAVYVLSSRSEGMPLALLEAMACGAPCVATSVGGVPEVLTAETGKLVPPEAPEQLARAMTLLLQNKDHALRLGREAHRRAQAFSSAVSDAAYEEVYQEVLGERPARLRSAS